jgi:hypothetical protein
MIIFVSDAFSEQYNGGAELTTDAIIDSSLFPVNKILSQNVNLSLLQEYKSSFWIFGNFSGVSAECLLYAAKNLDYSVIEYDYKFCKYRSVKKHEKFEDTCNCHTTNHGKLVASFLARSKMNFWMSKKQCDIYTDIFPFIKNNTVLSSVFSDDTLFYLNKLRTTNKNNKWIILDSPSWIKGREDAILYAKEHNMEYELVWGLEYEELLKKLANSRGLILLPPGKDTCPRLAIESKILGCKLVLNDNVQHKDEEWFESKDTIIKHLQTRGSVFWRNIEEVASDNLKIAKNSPKTTHNLKIVIPFYNAEKWLSKCIKSLKMQDYGHFECFLVDDMSSDDSYGVAKRAIGLDDRFKLTKNRKKRYALGNISRTIEKADCKADDVIILIDGDDWLASSYSLSTLACTYDKKDCLITYGSYVYNPTGQRGVEPSEYSDEVIKNNLFREDAWRASHLRSFRYSLWKNLNQEDLKDKEGKYYAMAYDQAIMLPLLEMASTKSKYIEESLYVYNKENPLNVDKIKAQQQFDIAQEIRAKAPYKKL